MNFLEGLNPDQADGAMADGNCLITACPGSGKSKTLANKAARLLSAQNTVCAVSFTKDSAIELREKILSLAGGDKAPKKLLTAGTFHSLCLKQIGGGVQAMASEGDKVGMVKRALQSTGLEGDFTPEDAMRVIERVKNARTKLPDNDPHGQLFRSYQDLLARNKKIDFQDLVINAVEGMKTGAVKPFNVEYMLVDEFQDADQLQLEWVMLHAKAGVKVTVVGDDDQSIYGFRQALGYAGMENFATEFNAKKVVLAINYRCHEEILSHAGKLIVSNKTRIPKALQAAKGPGGSIGFKQFLKKEKEAQAIAEAYCDVIRTQESYAVISRNNRKLDPVESCLISYGIPYFKAGGGSFLDRYEVSLLFDLIRFSIGASTTGMDNALAWAGMTEDDLKAIHKKFGHQLIRGSKQDLEDSGVSEDGRALWREFVKRSQGWIKAATTDRFNLLITGIREWLNEQAETKFQIENIEMASDLLCRLNGTLQERMDLLSKSNRKDPPEGPHIVLITMHSSKGLEWDHVWIIASEETVIPDEKSSVEEERRLMYVAMTRARKDLMMSSSGSNPVSRFVIEAQVPNLTMSPSLN